MFAAAAAVGESGATLDAGKLSARGVAAADLRAPSADIARVKAERSARDRAKKKLAAALGTLRPHLGTAAKERLVDAAEARDISYGSDGSVQLTLSLPVPAVDAPAPAVNKTSKNPDAAAVDEHEERP